MENLFVIDGVRQAREDLNRKWVGSYVILEVKGKEQLACFREFGDVNVSFYLENAARVTVEAAADVLLKREFPEVNVANYAAHGRQAVLLLSRTGERQWTRGLARGAFEILCVSGDQESNFVPDFEVSKSLFYPSFTNIKQAVNHCLHNKEVSHAINPRFWVKQVMIAGQKYAGLYRKEICIGLLSDASLKSFYLQGGCSPFKREIDAVLKGLQ